MSDLRKRLHSTAKVVGLRQVRRAIGDGGIDTVVLAADADAPVRSEVQALCDRHGVKLQTIPSKHELGRICGIDVACAVVGLTAGE